MVYIIVRLQHPVTVKHDDLYRFLKRLHSCSYNHRDHQMGNERLGECAKLFLGRPLPDRDFIISAKVHTTPTKEIHLQNYQSIITFRVTQPPTRRPFFDQIILIAAH